MKNLVKCGRCESNGRINVLGEIDSGGDFLVLRFHKGTTRVIGESFTVVCDLCQEPIYIRKGGNLGTVFDYRFERIFGFSFKGTASSLGSYGSARG